MGRFRVHRRPPRSNREVRRIGVWSPTWTREWFNCRPEARKLATAAVEPVFPPCRACIRRLADSARHISDGPLRFSLRWGGGILARLLAILQLLLLLSVFLHQLLCLLLVLLDRES